MHELGECVSEQLDWVIVTRRPKRHGNPTSQQRDFMKLNGEVAPLDFLQSQSGIGVTPAVQSRRSVNYHGSSYIVPGILGDVFPPGKMLLRHQLLHAPLPPISETALVHVITWTWIWPLSTCFDLAERICTRRGGFLRASYLG